MALVDDSFATDCATTVRALIASGSLQPHFQPIVRLDNGEIHGHESLIRTPADCPWRTPDQLFAAARHEGLGIELELECARLALRAWARAQGKGRLFLNLSAQALVTALAQRDIESMMSVIRSASLAPEGLVVELTEHERVKDVDSLAAAVGRLRRHRVAVALDDFGDGRSSLRLWAELKPEVVKIDRYFTRDLRNHPERVQTLRALMQISQTLGSSLVAEGIETADDLHLVRDLGISLGQGWMLGYPAQTPMQATTDGALTVIRSRDLAVFPERRRTTQHRASGWTLLREAPALTTEATCEQLFERFNADPSLGSMAIVDDGRPVGLVSRRSFIDRYAKPFVKELFGKRPCLEFANLTPRLVDIQSGIDELAAVLTSDDQSYLSEGIVITEAGRYKGLGAGEDLVRVVTESRIEAARHANPLTLLPGNIPLTQHLQRLIDSGREFVACYCDLNHFKPYNDLYGYWRGDEMILLASRCLQAQSDVRRDFVGHVGGDDFVVVFQSQDWEQRCRTAVASFDREAAGLYDESARAAGGTLAEDRHGVVRFHPLTTMSIGAVPVMPFGPCSRAEDVANAAARAKRKAKHDQLPLYVDHEDCCR